MAKNRGEPSAPRGVGTERITKRAAYGNYGSDEQSSRVREPGLAGREPWQGEERVERSPARPIVRQWATPSYDPLTGRGARVGDDSFAGKTRHDGPERWKQQTNAGTHTVTQNNKARSRPGRW